MTWSCRPEGCGRKRRVLPWALECEDMSHAPWFPRTSPVWSCCHSPVFEGTSKAAVSVRSFAGVGRGVDVLLRDTHPQWEKHLPALVARKPGRCSVLRFSAACGGRRPWPRFSPCSFPIRLTRTQARHARERCGGAECGLRSLNIIHPRQGVRSERACGQAGGREPVEPSAANRHKTSQTDPSGRSCRLGLPMVSWVLRRPTMCVWPTPAGADRHLAVDGSERSAPSLFRWTSAVVE